MSGLPSARMLSGRMSSARIKSTLGFPPGASAPIMSEAATAATTAKQQQRDKSDRPVHSPRSIGQHQSENPTRSFADQHSSGTKPPGDCGLPTRLRSSWRAFSRRNEVKEDSLLLPTTSRRYVAQTGNLPCRRLAIGRAAAFETRQPVCSSRDPSAAHHEVVLIKDACLARSNGALRDVEFYPRAAIPLPGFHCRGRARMIIPDFRRHFD